MELTVGAIPGYYATMAAEYWYLRRRAAREGPSASDYERRDTLVSLTMGAASLLTPLVLPRLVHSVTHKDDRVRRGLLAAVAGAVVVTTVADRIVAWGEEPATPGRAPEQAPGVGAATGLEPAGAMQDGGRAAAGIPSGPARRRRRHVVGAAQRAAGIPSGPARRWWRRHLVGAAQRAAGIPSGPARRWWRRHLVGAAQRAAAGGGVTAVALGTVTAAAALRSWTADERLWRRRVLPDLGGGPLALAAAVLGWDFIYYWNHRLQHESRFLWAIHVVHHSSERYNLSTALRQPVSDVFGTFVPPGALTLFGIRPGLVASARGINLLYQYWIHTDAIGRLGAAEAVLNTPSHHRVHHGSNRQYLDRNHGSILIVWDRLFGTFEPEAEPARYGLTKNVRSFNPVRVATHEYADVLRDVARSTTWRDRLSFVLRGPGWAYSRQAERDGLASQAA